MRFNVTWISFSNGGAKNKNHIDNVWCAWLVTRGEGGGVIVGGEKAKMIKDKNL